MSAPRSSLTLAFPLVATALVPDEADACPVEYDCDDVPAWVDLDLRNAAAIPVDGVLVFEGKRLGEGDPLANITVAVTRDGQPVAGAFEATTHRDALIWRPAEPWQPGAGYVAEGVAMNPGIYGYCGLEEQPFGSDFVVDSEPSGALGVPEFTGTVTPQNTYELSLENIACCESAAPPTLSSGYCGGYYVQFETGACAPTRTTGYFTLEILGDPAADGPVAAGIVYAIKQDDVVVETSMDPSVAYYTTHTAPVCVIVEAIDLGTGSVTVSAEQCFGQDIVDELGPKDIVPDLVCPLEQCAVVDNTWDKTMCTPFPGDPDTDSDTPTGGDTDTPTGGDTDALTGGDTDPGSGSTDNATDPEESGDNGCACDATTAPPGALLAVPLLLAARRRRR
jgi:hypothetical protein